MMRDKAIAQKNGGGSDSRSPGLKTFGMACLSLFSLTLIGSANIYAGTVDMSTLLSNYNFQLGNVAPVGTDNVGCPKDWNCSSSGLTPGGTAYQPNGAPPPGSPTNPTINNPSGADFTTQYVAGSDGLNSLGSTFVTPNGAQGTWAAQVPDHEGNGAIMQTSLGTYVNGSTYAVNLWVGIPLTVFDLVQTSTANPPFCAAGLQNPCAGAPDNIQVIFLGGGVALADQAPIVVTPSSPGQWVLDPISITATAADVTQGPIGFEIRVFPNPNSVSSNNEVADFAIEAIPTSSTPEPGTFALIGIALISLAYFFRRKLA